MLLENCLDKMHFDLSLLVAPGHLRPLAASAVVRTPQPARMPPL